MKKTTVTFFDRLENTIICNFAGDHQLALDMALSHQPVQHKWRRWRYTDTVYMTGIQEIRLLNPQHIPVIKYGCQADPGGRRFDLLEPSYRQIHLVKYLEAARNRLNDYYEPYPKGLATLIADTKLAFTFVELELEILKSSRVPLGLNARPAGQSPGHIRLFQPPIGGL